VSNQVVATSYTIQGLLYVKLTFHLLHAMYIKMKYVLLVPSVAHSVYKFVTSKKEEKDWFYVSIFPVLLLRLLYGQLWISISRYQTARSKRRIVTKSLDFEQVDRERNW
jgi:aldehyde decarbonylase